MKHARPDYARIQDPAGKIPEDEPVFLLRGQDAAAWRAVAVYADLAREAGAAPELVAMCRDWASRMQDWAVEFGKTPDLAPPEMPEIGTIGRIPDNPHLRFRVIAIVEGWLVVRIVSDPVNVEPFVIPPRNFTADRESDGGRGFEGSAIRPGPAPQAASYPAEEQRLRDWLHRIDEAVAAKPFASTFANGIRDAALAALRGKDAPRGPGLPL